MKITGIVCEYNPMHNGHIYHIEKTRENGATHIIAVMSGNFVQRGETALMEKHKRASLAIRGGADVVIEIPVIYCLSSAEFYAKSAVSILDSLGCVSEISFGSECGDINILSAAAEAMRNIPRDKLQECMKTGMTYPAAAAAIVGERHGEETAGIISAPNNILAVEYINAIYALDSSITPFTVERCGAEHDSQCASGKFSSASNIRKLIAENKGFERFAPGYVCSEYRNTANKGRLSDIKNLERVILYKLRTSVPSELKQLPDVGQGLEYRLKQAEDSCTVQELLERVKTKRYTMARLKRILLNMLMGTTAGDLKILPPYARILALNEKGREILSMCRNSKIPFSTSLSKLSETGEAAGRVSFLEGISSDIYGLSQNNPGSKNDDFRALVRIEQYEKNEV